MVKMLKFIDKIPYLLLLFFALFMLLAPFRPMPHAAEKILMLRDGTLTRPIDIFDLFYHVIPTGLLLLRIYRDFMR